MELRPFCLLQITDAERHVLHKIALSRLQALNLGCPVAIPKGNDLLSKKNKIKLNQEETYKQQIQTNINMNDNKASSKVKRFCKGFSMPAFRTLFFNKLHNTFTQKFHLINCGRSPTQIYTQTLYVITY